MFTHNAIRYSICSISVTSQFERSVRKRRVERRWKRWGKRKWSGKRRWERGKERNGLEESGEIEDVVKRVGKSEGERRETEGKMWDGEEEGRRTQEPQNRLIWQNCKKVVHYKMDEIDLYRTKRCKNDLLAYLWN